MRPSEEKVNTRARAPSDLLRLQWWMRTSNIPMC